eukprot:CAMPEP_0204230224 /NCGR_PEP_ID=MMETSP0361-20130328/87814_1 /ASSEMBLY_ACC=CAM_ASM_000343 /TAXON_ID=268821 /ORGANISM="Scrippsiella Hangoei, Strain SHTV-5" /LENGTH=79 /DNA_ID=CAMNT_0051199123 /DNA_START=28 /DNA_END=265 /DNA_ORIENTATION=+
MAQQIEDTSATLALSPCACSRHGCHPGSVHSLSRARAQHKASAVLDKGRAEMRSVYYSDCDAHGARMMSRAGSTIDAAD